MERHSAPDAPRGGTVAVLQHPGIITGVRHHCCAHRWRTLQHNPFGGLLPLQLRDQTNAGRVWQCDRGEPVCYLRVGDGFLQETLHAPEGGAITLWDRIDQVRLSTTGGWYCS